MITRVLQVDVDPSLFPYSYEAEEIRRAGGELIVTDCTTEAEVLEHAPGAEVLWLTWRPVITPAVMRALPSCRLIIRWGVGYEQIDTHAATELGIAVANAPTYGTDDVAEHAIALLLSWARRITWLHERMRSGEWSDVTTTGIHRLTGRTLGIIGMGRIGSKVAARAHALGLRVIACDPAHSDEELRRRHAEPATLQDLLAESDYISLHVPLTRDTERLIDTTALQRLKREALLINTSRGRVVDQDALAEALRTGRLAGAALDVFAEEPLPTDSPLRSMEQVILTPHAAGYSIESWSDLRKEMCATTTEWIKHSWTERVVNPQVRERLRPRQVNSA